MFVIVCAERFSFFWQINMISDDKERDDRRHTRRPIESVLREGASFFFTRPVIIADSDEVSAGEPVPDAPAKAESSAGPAPVTEGTVLVAEDNAINALVVRTILEKAGYTVYLASTGVEALDQLARVSADMVLMDVSMPDMDGFLSKPLEIESFLELVKRHTGQR